ncbi:MAG: arabinan endo-1,5-alpha-L-arabinosidase [Polyangiales bacterium]
MGRAKTRAAVAPWSRAGGASARLVALPSSGLHATAAARVFALGCLSLNAAACGGTTPPGAASSAGAGAAGAQHVAATGGRSGTAGATAGSGDVTAAVSGGAGRAGSGGAAGAAESAPTAGGGVAGTGGAAGSGTMAGASAAGAAGAADAGMLDAGAVDAALGVDAAVGGDSDRCNVGKSNGMPPNVLSLSGNTFAHDPTMIEAGGVFYRFWTGDNIPSASSTDLMSWRDAPTAYRGGYPQWSREWLGDIPGETFNFPWAPDVSFFNGQFHIYSSFSAKFGDNISCITHLTTSDIAAGPWTDHGPVICTEGNEPYNAIDADVELDADGKPYLAFGSFWDGIMAMPLAADGGRIEGQELTRLAWAREIEAPVLLRRCGYYYLFITWGLCCPGENRTLEQLTYRVAVGRSENILGPYVDKAGKPLLEGGGTLLVEGGGNYAAAGHSDVLVTGDKIYHLYHAYRRPRGEPELRIAELPFDDQGWPIAADEP